MPRMTVSALFFPTEVAVSPGGTASFTLQLQNTTDGEQVVTLTPQGLLAESTLIQSERVHLDPNERFDVPVTIAPTASVTAGPHECRIEVVAGEQTSSVIAVVDVAAHSAFVARLEPTRSRSSKAGRHKVIVENAGNTPILVTLGARPRVDTAASPPFDAAPSVADTATSTMASPAPPITPPSTATFELSTHEVIVEPGASSRVDLRVVPLQRYWNGDPQSHLFAVDVVADMGERIELAGEYEQTPRVKSWVGPALAGMLGALLLWLLAWFLLMRPAIENIAEEQAAELDALQQAELDRRVEEIQIAAEEAAELPLGEPTDLRLSTAAPAGSEAVDAFDFDRSGTGRTLSISDIIFQNPTGAVGTVEFLRDGEVLLQQEMANFRDLDFNLVAPFRVNSGSSIGLRVVCTTPGPTTGECQVAATIIGFVDG